jgi:hypothetical protein
MQKGIAQPRLDIGWVKRLLEDGDTHPSPDALVENFNVKGTGNQPDGLAFRNVPYAFALLTFLALIWCL